MKKLLSYAFLALGCSTAYGPKGFTGGYSDFPVAGNRHYVSFEGNGYTSRAAVAEMWHRRAAEICGGKDRYRVTTTQGGSDTSYVVSNGMALPVNKPFVEGYVECF